MDLSYTNVLTVCTWVDCLLFQIQLQGKVCIVCSILKCVRYIIFTASIKQLSIFLRTAYFICRGQFYCHVQTSIIRWIHGVSLVLVKVGHRGWSCGVCESGDTWRTMRLHTLGRFWYWNFRTNFSTMHVPVNRRCRNNFVLGMKYCCGVFARNLRHVAWWNWSSKKKFFFFFCVFHLYEWCDSPHAAAKRTRLVYCSSDGHFQWSTTVPAATVDVVTCFD
jgi:hypothetical protein